MGAKEQAVVISFLSVTTLVIGEPAKTYEYIHYPQVPYIRRYPVSCTRYSFISAVALAL